MKRLHKEYDTPQDYRDQFKKGKAGASNLYLEYKDGIDPITGRKKRLHPDTILEEEEDKELGDSSSMQDNLRKQKTFDMEEEEKVPLKQFEE